MGTRTGGHVRQVLEGANGFRKCGEKTKGQR